MVQSQDIPAIARTSKRRQIFASKLLNLPALKQLAKDYILPFTMTIIFLLSVLAVAYVRANEKVEIADLAASSATSGQDYAKLLSGDQQDKFVVGGTNSDGSETGSSTATPDEGAFNINPGLGAGSPSQEGGTTAPAQFSASVANFAATGSSLTCPLLDRLLGNCTKTYAFNAGVRTANGPGPVSYGWQSNAAGASSGGSYTAGSGTDLTSLGKSITIRCDQAGTYNLQLQIHSPSVARSNVISFSHSC